MIREDQIDLFDCEPPIPTITLDGVSSHMKAFVDSRISRLKNKRFIDDPICGSTLSRITSIVSSIQKRHGHIIEAALLDALHNSPIQIWTEKKFSISSAADQLCESQTLADCRRSELPYGEANRQIQIDVGTFYDAAIRSYEVKRANGLHDAGKIRSMRRDLRCTQVLLRSYGDSHEMPADNATALVIFYYGLRHPSIPAPYSLTGAELDDHFHFPVIAQIEAVNEYFRRQLNPILQQMEIRE